MRTIALAAMLILFASNAEAFTKAQLRLYNRLPDTDWFVIHLSERDMISVSMKRLPVKEERLYRDVWLRWDLIDHPADAGRSSGLVVDIDCQKRQTLEKKVLGYDTALKRETVRETNELREWIPDSDSEKAYETFCSGFDQALIEWRKRPAVETGGEPD